MTKRVGLLLVVLAVAAVGYGQSQVRGTVTSELVVEPSDAEGVSGSLRAEDLAVLSIRQELSFLEGIQLEVQVPEAVREAGGGFAIYVYDGVAPAPSSARRDYRGRRVFFRPIPEANRFFVTIPISQRHALRPTAGAFLIEEVIAPERFPILVTILPVMKGIPGAAMRADFTVAAKPLLLDIGAADLVVLDPEGTDILESAGSLREFQLYLDGERIDYGPDPLVLAPGLHKLALESTRYENQRLTFGVERGSISNVEVRLEEPRSAVTFEAPEGVTLFIDGESVDHRAPDFSLPAGEHTVTFQIGEYSVSKKFAVEPKKSYKISLSLDILVNED